jgi:hypothetical protein
MSGFPKSKIGDPPALSRGSQGLTVPEVCTYMGFYDGDQGCVNVGFLLLFLLLISPVAKWHIHEPAIV